MLNTISMLVSLVQMTCGNVTVYYTMVLRWCG